MGPEEYLRDLMSTMKKFREEKVLCDTILIADDQELWAHSVVLAAISPFLCSTFKDLGGTKTRKIRYNISLPGCSASDVELVLQFLYSGHLVIPSSFQQTEEFARILFVCRTLGIDLGKLNGARVTFENDFERMLKPLSTSVSKINSTRDTENGELENALHESHQHSLSFDDDGVISSDLQFDCCPTDEQSLLKTSPSLSSTGFPANYKHTPGHCSRETEKHDLLLTESQNQAIISEQFTKRLGSQQPQRGNDEFGMPPRTQLIVRVGGKTVTPIPSTDEWFDCPENVLPDKQGRSLDVKLSPSVEDLIKHDSSDVLKYSFDDCRNTNRGSVIQDSDKNQKLYTCLTCGKEFLKQRCFRKHVQSHASRSKSHVCDKCGKMFPTTAALKVHQKVHVDGHPHVCEVCGKGYKFKRYLQIHAMTHTGTKPFLCDTCGRGFYVITNLKRHVLMWHTTIRPYVCSTCGKGFVTRPRLVKHAETHSGERLYSCEICGSSFSNAGNLSRHRMLHTGEKPYVCPVCMRGFTQKVTMQSHMTTHADQRVAFECPACGKNLSKASNLKKHMQMHSQQKPYVCDVCGKCFAIKEYLSRHSVTHSEKRHVCETCGKGYCSERFLSTHVKTHLAKPCLKCGKEFVGSRALNTHMRIHLAEETLLCSTSDKGFKTGH